MVTAINSRDYPQIRGSVLLLAFTYSIVNLLVDILYAYLDPRIKAQYMNEGRGKRHMKQRKRRYKSMNKATDRKKKISAQK